MFVAKLAVYARTQMHLRSFPLLLTVELAKRNAGGDLVSRTVSWLVQRAKEITELLAYYQLSNSRTSTKKLGRLSKQLQKGLALAFNRLDEYQFAKYNRATEVRLRDALFLVHCATSSPPRCRGRTCSGCVTCWPMAGPWNRRSSCPSASWPPTAK